MLLSKPITLDLDCILDCLDCLDRHNGEDEDEQISITTEDPFTDDKDQSELQEEETEIDQLKTEVFISQFDWLGSFTVLFEGPLGVRASEEPDQQSEGC